MRSANKRVPGLSGSKPKAPKRRARRLAVETLEQRLVMSADIVSNGLRFRDVVDAAWDGSAVNTEVQIGKDTGSAASFTPLLDVNGGFQLAAAGQTPATASTTAAVSTVQVYSATAQSVFSGTHAFSVANAALSPTDGGASNIAVLGFPLAVSSLSLADGASVQAAGSFSVAGISVPLPGGTTIPIAASGPSTPSFSVTLGTGTGVSLKGLDFSLGSGGANTATAGFDAPSQSFYVDGTGSFSWGKSATDPNEKTNSIGLTLGNVAAGVTTHGLVFKAGDLDSLNAAITTDLNYRGLAFHLGGLGLNYVKAGSLYEVDGSASVDWKGGSADGTTNTLSLALGNATTHGLVVSNGVLQSLDATLSGSVSLKNLATIATGASGLHFGYTAAGSTFELDGSASLTKLGGDAQAKPITVTLGTHASPGLAIAGGDLQSLNVGLTGSLSLKGLDVGVAGLTLLYTKATGLMTLDGTATVGWGSASADAAEKTNAVTVTLGKTVNGVVTHGVVLVNGQLDSLDATINADIAYRGLAIKAENLDLIYVKAGAQYTLDGAASIAWKGGSGGDAIGLTLGETDSKNVYHHGLVISGGVLQSLDAAVSGNISIKGLASLSSSGLHVGYVASTTSTPSSIEIDGSATLSIGGTNGPLKSATVLLGTSPTDPGLVLSNGDLQSFKVGVSGEFSLSSLHVTANALTLSYVVATQTFVADGGATISWGKATPGEGTNEVAITLGNIAAGGSDHGIVIQNGSLSSFHGTINAHLNYRSLDFNLQGVTVGYVSATSSFTIDGTASLAWSGGKGAADAISVTLGGTDDKKVFHDGLVISGGALQSLYASITADFSVKSAITIGVKNLTVQYDASANDFTIDGSATITAGSNKTLQSVTATLGDGTAAHHGIVIVDGDLQSFYVSLSGTFGLGGVTVSPKNLTLGYDNSNAADPTFLINGGIQVNLTSSISVGGGFSSPLLIHAKTGAVDLDKGFGIYVDGDFKAFHVTAAFSYVAHAGGGYDVVAKGSLTTPAGIGFDAYLHLANGHLVDIAIGVSAKIAVGDTGLFITWVYGSLNNLDTDDPTITAAATLVYGDANILSVTGAIEVNKEHLLLSADPANLPVIYTSGQVSVADHRPGVYILDGAIGQFAGSVDLEWAAGVYKVHASGVLLAGLATVDVGITLDKAGDLSFSADVGIQIPSYIPLIGGTKLASGHVRLEYLHGDINHSYVAAWAEFLPGTFLSFTAGVDYNFGTSKFSFLDAAAIASLPPSPTVSTPAGPAFTVDYPVTVTGDTASLQFVISDDYLDENNPNQVAGVSSPGQGYFQGGNFAYGPSRAYAYTNFLKVVSPDPTVPVRYYPLTDSEGDFLAAEHAAPSYIPYSGLNTLILNGPSTTPNTLDVPSVDPIQGTTATAHSNSSRVLTILPKDGSGTIKTGTYHFTLISANAVTALGFHDTAHDGSANGGASLSAHDLSLKTHIALTPIAPTFGYAFASGSYHPATFQNAAPVAVQTDLDKTLVTIPVDSYNPTGPNTVSLYASTIPLPAGTDPSGKLVEDGNGNPILDAQGLRQYNDAAVLVDREQPTFSPVAGATDVNHVQYSYKFTVPASSLPSLVGGNTRNFTQRPAADGNTPIYYYAVVDDGLGHHQFSPASNPVTLPAGNLAIGGTGDLVSDYHTPIVLRSAQGGLLLDVTQPNSGTLDYGVNINVTTGTGVTLFDGSFGSYVDTVFAGNLKYTPPASGIPASGYDTIIITATHSPNSGRPYVTTATFRVLPQYNVDLSATQEVNQSSTYEQIRALGSTPIPANSTLTIALNLQNVPTQAGGKPVVVGYLLPSGFSYVSSRADNGTFNPSNGLWSVNPTATGTANLLIVARSYRTTFAQDGALKGQILSGPANLSLGQTYYAPTDASRIASSNGQPVSTPPAAEGSTIAITLTAQDNVKNAGALGAAAGVAVQYPLPAGLTYVSSSGSGTYDPVAGTWTVGKLADKAASLVILATVNVGASAAPITSTATVVPGTNADGSAQPDINPGNLQSTATFSAVKQIAGYVYLTNDSVAPNDSNNKPSAGNFIYLLEGNAADDREFALNSGTTDANGRYGFDAPTPAAGFHLIVRIYGAGGDTSQVVDSYPVTTPSFRTSAVAPSSITGTIDHARYPSYNGSKAPASAFSAKAGGLVYLDLNNNDQWDANEPSAVADTNGKFAFYNIAPGNYSIRELIKPGRIATDANGNPAPDSTSVRTTPGGTVGGLQFNYVDQITIQGHQFVDVNANGTLDADESGQAGWTFTLQQATVQSNTVRVISDPYHPFASTNQIVTTRYVTAWNTVGMVVSDPSGKYHFDNLAPGVYQVLETLNRSTKGTWTRTLRSAGTGPVEVLANGDVVLNTIAALASPAYVSVQAQPPTVSFYGYVLTSGQDTGANHQSHLDFGDKFTPSTPSKFAAFAVRAEALAPATTAADTFKLSTPYSSQAGEVSSFTVTAIGPDGLPDTAYRGTVDLASSDDAALLDSSYIFTEADQGSRAFNVSLMTPGRSTVSVADEAHPAGDATSTTIVVNGGMASQCVVTGPAAITPGSAYSLTLNPVDKVGDTDPNYWGTSTITTSLAVNGVVVDPSKLPASVRAWLDARGGLPASYQFGLDNHGIAKLGLNAPTLDPAAVALIPGLVVGGKAGQLSLVVNVSDTTGQIAPVVATIPIQVTLPIVVVTPKPIPNPTPTPTPIPVHQPTIVATLQGPSAAVAGLPLAILLGVSPASGSTSTAAHVIHFTSTDPAAALPPDTTVVPGGPALEVFATLETPGSQTITAIDTADGTVVGRSTLVVRPAQATPAARMVDAIYQTLLGHPADAPTLAKSRAALAKGASPGRLAAALTRGSEYATAQVDRLFRSLLGRAPSAAERNLDVARLQKGGSVAALERDLLAGGEYLRLQGGQGSGFLTGLGRDVLGRNLTAAEQAEYAARLARGASRSAVAAAVINGRPARQIRADRLFESLIGRAPTAAESNRWAAVLLSPKAETAVVAGLVDSLAFRAEAGVPVKPTAPTAARAATVSIHPVARIGGIHVRVAAAHPVARIKARFHQAETR